MPIEWTQKYVSESIPWVPSFEQLDKEFSHKYLFVRAINQLMNGYDFYSSVDPYAPHISFSWDKINRIYDHTSSWIDLKSSSRKDILVFVKEKLNIIQDEDPWFLHRILHLDEDKNIDALIIIDLIKDIIKNHVKSEKVDHKTKERIKNAKYQTIKRLYRLIPKKRDFFEEDPENVDCIKLSSAWKQYFTRILSDLVSHYDSTLALGKDWRQQVFPNELFAHELGKITSNTPLSEKELHNIIAHLSREINKHEIEYLIKHGEITDSKTIKNVTNGIKSFILNHAYASIYVEQYYNHFLTEALTKDRNNKHHEDAEYFTEKSQKWLASSANKELRKETIRDRTRARTWVDKSIFEKWEWRQNKIVDIFNKELNELKQSFDTQWYTMNISSIEVVNKYKSWETVISEDEVKNIQDNLHKKYDIVKDVSKIAKKKKTTPIIINRDFCEQTLDLPNDLIDWIQQAFIADGGTSGWNWDYADIKIRVAYTITNKETWDEIQETGWYEHQIVPFDSTNEAWLSSHEIILEPRKNIINQIRNKGQISIDEFSNSVHGWLIALIAKLRQREDRIDTEYSSTRNHREPHDFITKQLELRNLIPQEFCEIAWLQHPLTYTEIANNLEYKNKIEKAIEIHLLQELFDNNIIHWYLYANDEDDLWNTWWSRIDTTLSTQHYCNYADATTYLQQALAATPNQKKNFRILWWWSGNFTNSLCNATISNAWYIAINYKWKNNNKEIAFIKVDRLANILYASSQTWKNTDFSKEIAELLTSNKE